LKYNDIEIEYVKEFTASMAGDKSIEPIYKQFMELITPGSIVTFGGFGKIEEVS
jgi:hypothetical protein